MRVLTCVIIISGFCGIYHSGVITGYDVKRRVE